MSNKCTKIFKLIFYYVSWTLKYYTMFSSVTQSYLTLCDPFDCSTPGLPVHHQLLKLAQTHVHQVGDAIQPPHPLSSLSPPAFNLFLASGSFPMIQFFHIRWPKYWSFSFSIIDYSGLIIQDWFPLGWTGWISLQFKGLTRVFSNTSI